jgi:hypothetical protein
MFCLQRVVGREPWRGKDADEEPGQEDGDAKQHERIMAQKT